MRYEPPRGSIPTLEVPDLGAIGSAHLVGIGGAGMSGLGWLLLARDIRVSGSDLKESPSVMQLRAAGAEVHVGHDAANLGSPDAVIVSTAIAGDNPEVRAARDRGVPVLARAQVLAAMMRDGRGVAVAGTHGKTSTTSMLAVILERAGADPTYVVGGDLNESGSNARSGRGDVFLAEADESDGSFLLLEPEIAIVTNVEVDHLDFFADRSEIEAAFAVFCERAKLVIACADDPGVGRVIAAAGIDPLWYGEHERSEVRVSDIEGSRAGTVSRLRIHGEEAWEGALEVPVPGRQHALNAAGAVAAAMRLGVAPTVATDALRGFGGVRRRWERRGESAGTTFVDDYAHHPTEIAATLAAARDGGHARVLGVFQPHRYSRTAGMWRALGESLRDADVVIVTDVYGAGEEPMMGVTGKLVVDALVEAAPGKRAIYLPRRPDLAPFLAREVRAGDLVLTLGAGDVTMVAKETLAILDEARDGG